MFGAERVGCVCGDSTILQDTLNRVSFEMHFTNQL